MAPLPAQPAAAGSPPHSVLTTLQGCETGQLRLSRRHTANLQQTYITQQLHSLTLKPLTDAQQTVDKAFCSLWLDNDTVLVGTKCNSLLTLQPRYGSHSLLQYPQQYPQQQEQQQQTGLRQGPELQAVPAAISCGQHALALSPDGQWLATGGQAPNDILLWHVSCQQRQQQQQQPGLQMRPGTCSSRTVVQPVQTLKGHADWVFEIAWLDETRFVSAGRDKLIKLWQLPQAARATASAECSAMRFSAEPGAALSSVRYHTDKVRCVRYNRQQQTAVTACMDGVVAWWTPELQLAGACKLPGNCPGPQSLLLQGNLAVVGTQRAALLIDSRVGRTPVASVAVGKASQRKRRRLETPAATAAVGCAAAAVYEGDWSAAAAQQEQQEQLQQQQCLHDQQQHQQQQQVNDTYDEQSSESYFESDDELSSDAEDATAEDAVQIVGSGSGEAGNGQQQQQQGLDPGALQRQLAGRLLASLRSNNTAEQWRLQQQLPGQVVYAIQRFVEQEVRSQQARADRSGMSTEDLQFYRQHGSSRLRYAEGPQDGLAAHVSGSICVESQGGFGANGVRSLSLHHHLLGLGCCGGQLLMHDMRKLSSTAAAQSSSAAEHLQQWPLASGNASSRIPPDSSSWVDGSTGSIPARVGRLELPELAWRQPAAAGAVGALTDADLFWAPELSGGGRVVYGTSELAVFTHAWNPSGTQLFMGGGPVVLAGKGCSLALCC